MDYLERQAIDLKATCPVCGGDVTICQCQTYQSSKQRPLSTDGHVTGFALDSVIGSVINARYELIEALGTGGMGCVYKARHIALNKFVALKLLRADLSQQPEFMRRFDREAKTAGLLDHPNLVAVHDYGLTENNEAFIVMDFLDGISLSRRLSQERRLSVPQAVKIFLQICDGLDYAHGLGIIHRDLKPANIMLVKSSSGEEQAKIVDFGIAKFRLEAETAEAGLTKTGDVFGSPFYMSPEQSRGDVPDHRSDIYSLGCLMYECLASVPPFVGQNSFATMRMHAEAAPSPFNRQLKIPPQLENIVFKCLAKLPTERYHSADQLRNDLERLVKVQQRNGSFTTAGMENKSASNRKVILFGGIASSALLLFVLACYQIISPRSLSPAESQKPGAASDARAPSTMAGNHEPAGRTKGGAAESDSTKSLQKPLPSVSYEQLLEEGKKALDASLLATKRGDPATARSERNLGFGYLAQAIKLNEDIPGAYETREIYDWKFGLIDQGIADCEKLVELDPADTNVYSELATFYDTQGRTKEALATIEAALRRAPDGPVFLEKRAFYSYKLGDFKTAIREFDLIADSSKPNTMQLLADSYRHVGQPEKALQKIDEFFQKRPKSGGKERLSNDQLAFAYCVRADAERDLRRNGESIADLEKAVALEPGLLASRRTELEHWRKNKNVQGPK